MTSSNVCALTLLALALSLLAPDKAQAAQSYDNCTGYILSLPAVISTQGTWCLNKDVTTAIASGNAITINTNNVTIDCNDFKIGGLAAGVGTSTIGIFSQDHLNATIRHCNVRGFLRGIHLAGSSGGGHAVEDNRFDNNTFVGLQVEGDGSVVRRNRVFDTGGSTVAGDTDANGVVTAYSVDILDNTISGVMPKTGGGGNAFGIIMSSNPSGRIIGNGVHGLVKDGIGSAYGIFGAGTDRITLRDNDVVGDGLAGSIGLDCTSAHGGARDNVITGFGTALFACTDSGGNTIIP